MTGKFETRLAELGVTLADAPAPAANYVPFVQVGDLVFVSGQISQDANGFITGKLGDTMSTEAGARRRTHLRDLAFGTGQSRLRR